jgi:hypothetical protein
MEIISEVKAMMIVTAIAYEHNDVGLRSAASRSHSRAAKPRLY